MAREALRESHPDIADLVEELVPFTTEFLAALVTVVDEADLKQWGQYSEQTLQERYTAARDVVTRASAPLDPEIVQWQESIRQKAVQRMSDANAQQVATRAKMSVRQLEAQITRMREEAEVAASSLQAAANEEAAQHKAEIDAIKASVTAQITALEGQITTIKKESKQYLKALKKTQADEV